MVGLVEGGCVRVVGIWWYGRRVGGSAGFRPLY